MRRLLYLIMCLTCSMLARAQSTYQYRYWFDGDEAKMQTVTSDEALRLDIDLADLTEALHSLHVQVVDEKGVASSPLTRFFVKTSAPSGSKVNYWYDNLGTMAGTLGYGSVATELDVSHLADGVHTLHVQYASAAPSKVVTRTFVKLSTAQELAKGFCYWFDEDKENKQMLSGANVVAEIDASGLSDGLHKLHVQAIGNAPTITKSSFFLKIPQVKGVDRLTCVTSVDGVIYKQEAVPADDGVMHYDFDATGLEEGVHLLTVQVVAASGAASTVGRSYFLRANTAAEIAGMKCYYSVDGAEGRTIAGSYNNGAFHFDIDVADLTDGLHRITYLMSTENGKTTSIRNAFFMKTPLGGNGITTYLYWVNKNYEDHKQVKLAGRTNPLSIISLLPVETQPIRSEDFHFEFKDGKPMIYAQNDFHVRFYDASGRFTYETASYTDYNMAEEVTEIDTLISGTPVVKDKPAENEIQWYHFAAQIGDSLAFKVDRACTVQVFAPSGKEVYKASGSEVVNWDGCHAWEDGEYYLALHDVTAQQGTNTRLEYQHVDKYAVLSTDVLVVGNGGVNTISHDGNGFYHLTSISLVHSVTGVEIEAFDIEYLSDNRISASYDFTNAPEGIYIQKFVFDNEVRENPERISVEAEKGIIFDVSVNYPSVFLRGTTATYTVTLRNNGNMTAYNVPLYAYIASQTEEGISKITIDGLNLPSLIDGVDLSNWSKKEINALQQISDELGESHYFTVVGARDEETEDSITVRSNYFFTELKPYETRHIRFNITSTEELDVWFTVPEEWLSLKLAESEPQTYANAVRRASKAPSSSCVKVVYECSRDHFGPRFGLVASEIPHTQLDSVSAASCAAEKMESVIDVASKVANSEYFAEVSKWKEFRKALVEYSASSLALNCFKENVPDSVTLEMNDVKKVATPAIGISRPDCWVISIEKKPGKCPPGGKKHRGGGSTPVNSLDPNDITGYTAESGSHFVKKDLMDVHYKIEFENDPEFATASAHVVVVKDTIDSKLFDLATYAPTGVKVGEKFVELDGTPDFVKTIDMRPEIDAIALLEGTFDKTKGIATWTFTSLDPMTMEPTDDVMQGFLPVNDDNGRGQGEVTFNIKLMEGLMDGTEIPNRASIVFDTNEAIMTPTWVNIIDDEAPTSKVTDVEFLAEDTVRVSFEGEDNRSGIWRYTLYAQYGVNAPWVVMAENVDTCCVDVPFFKDIDYGFCVVATDMAGNVEDKTLVRELGFSSVIPGDLNGDGEVNVADIVTIVAYIKDKVYVEEADLNGDGEINVADIVSLVSIIKSQK